MPSYGSISITLVSQFDILTIPEFAPAPMSLSSTKDTSPDPVSLVNEEASLVSVYVPTYRGSQFWLTYSISPPYFPKAIFYFKLFLNQVHLVSWGVTEEDGYAGKTTFGLFQSQNGVLGRTITEKRGLSFGNCDQAEGTPPDVLEVRVFRSKGRKRHGIILGEVEEVMEKVHENERDAGEPLRREGINLPNLGAVTQEHPQEFYQYALIDPLDQPFATFRYYFRTWEQLEVLGVVPSEDVVSSCAETFQTAAAERQDPEDHGSQGRGHGASDTSIAPQVGASCSPRTSSCDVRPRSQRTARHSDNQVLAAIDATSFDRQRHTPSPHKQDFDDRTARSPRSPPSTGRRRRAKSNVRQLSETVKKVLKRRSVDSSP